jgi:hypothetical protein
LNSCVYSTERGFAFADFLNDARWRLRKQYCAYCSGVLRQRSHCSKPCAHATRKHRLDPTTAGCIAVCTAAIITVSADRPLILHYFTFARNDSFPRDFGRACRKFAFVNGSSETRYAECCCACSGCRGCAAPLQVCDRAHPRVAQRARSLAIPLVQSHLPRPSASRSFLHHP